MSEAASEIELHEALKGFFRTIEDTGGVSQDPKGFYRPHGDHDWIDLGDAYVRLCRAVDRKPMVTSTTIADEEE